LGLTLFFPILRKILPTRILGGVDVKERRERHRASINFMKGTIKQHQETYQENSPRDFIDVYLGEIAKTADPKSSFYGTEGGRNQES